jgi:hypothetical protein
MKMSSFFVLVVTLVACAQPARADGLEFRLSCEQNEAGCEELPLVEGGGKTLLVRKKPEMTIGRDGVEAAELTKDEFGQEGLSLLLNGEAASRFEKLTRDNIGGVLAVVAGGKILINPRINGPVPGGSLIITSAGSGSGYLDSVPWLKQMAESGAAGTQNRYVLSNVAYLVLGICLLGGSVYFAFLRKRKARS